MTNKWNQLNCQYFSSICLSELTEYFKACGFSRHSLDSVGGVVFEGRGVYVEVSYEVETFPRYSPTLLIGSMANNRNAVPFWFVIPSVDEASKYTFWKFETEVELRSVLAQIKNNVLEKFGEPLWADSVALEKQLQQFNLEFIQ